MVVKLELLYRQYFATPVPLDFMPENGDFQTFVSRLALLGRNAATTS